MQRLDLFELALANETKIADDFRREHAGRSSSDAARLDAFCRVIDETAGVSVNMSPNKLLGFLDAGRYLSVREIAALQAAASGLSPEARLRSMQGSYYDRRVAFETSFQNGEQFLYGALNIGGNAGVSGYGLFCAFFSDETMRKRCTAYLPDDSLARYVKPATVLSVDHVMLRQEVAPHTQRHSLAALKHKSEIASTPELQWGDLLCAPDCYVEVIFTETVVPADIAELRIEQDAMLRLSDLAFDELMGTLAPADRVELADFQACMGKLEQLGLAAKLREVGR